MVQFHLDATDGTLLLAPRGPLSASDFTALTAAVDSYIEGNGSLRGLLIEAPFFPGWDGLAGLTAHLRFIRDHHRLIRRVALVGDGAILSHLPELAQHFVSAEVRHFSRNERANALAWVRST